jgi:hypothetical protein
MSGPFVRKTKGYKETPPALSDRPVCPGAFGSDRSSTHGKAPVAEERSRSPDCPAATGLIPIPSKLKFIDLPT